MENSSFVYGPVPTYKREKIWSTIFFLVVVLLFSQLEVCAEDIAKATLESRPKDPVKEFIGKLTDQEREYLTNFFKVGFFVSCFGYTLYGDKPMCFELANMVEEPKSVEGIDYMAPEHILGYYRIREGYEVWKKYRDLLPLKGFSIIEYPFILNPDEIEIPLINHEKFLQVVSDNIEDFQTVLGKKLTPEEILSEYLKGKGEVFTQIRNHDGLFGTILGYGRNNAWEYYKRKGGKTMGPFIHEDPKDAEHISPPLFAALKGTEETEDLRKRYTQQRITADAVYRSDDFLEKVLYRLSGS